MEAPARPKRRGPLMLVRAMAGSSSGGGAAPSCGALGCGSGGGVGGRSCLRHPVTSALLYMALGAMLSGWARALVCYQTGQAGKKRPVCRANWGVASHCTVPAHDNVAAAANVA